MIIKIVRHFICGCIASIHGLRSAWQTEFALKVELWFSLLAIPAALLLGTTVAEKSILLFSWFLILLMELINSALETLVDRISLEIHLLSKRIKDIGSSLVFVAIIHACVQWGMIIFSQIFMK